MSTSGISDIVSTADALPRIRRGTPVWEIARLFPYQGEWTIEEFLELPRNPNTVVELTDGVIEFLHLPEEINGEPAPKSQPGTPVWEIAWLYPLQGNWTEQDYLALDTNRLIELTDGCLEFLPMPPPLHQWFSRLIQRALDDFVTPRKLGVVLSAPLPIRLQAEKLREPDVAYFHFSRFSSPDKPPNGADLVVEIVSEGTVNRHRDFTEKRDDYAGAGVSEYWLIDPARDEIIVLVLSGTEYSEHGAFRRGDVATSRLLDGFSIEVDHVLTPFPTGDDVPPETFPPRAS